MWPFRKLELLSAPRDSFVGRGMIPAVSGVASVPSAEELKLLYFAPHAVFTSSPTPEIVILAYSVPPDTDAVQTE